MEVFNTVAPALCAALHFGQVRVDIAVDGLDLFWHEEIFHYNAAILAEHLHDGFGTSVGVEPTQRRHGDGPFRWTGAVSSSNLNIIPGDTFAMQARDQIAFCK